MSKERMQQLAGIEISESAVTTPAIRKVVDEFARNKARLDELMEEVDEIKSRNKEIAEVIEPVALELEDRILETEDSIAHLSRVSTDVTSKKYKEAFELSLSKVNAATKRILEEALKETAEVSRRSGTWTTSVKESMWDDAKSFMKSLVSKFRGLFNSAKSIRDLTDELADIAENF